MGFEDRDYYRDRPQGFAGWMGAFFSKSFHLLTFRGIEVRAHITMVLFIAFTVLFGAGDGGGGSVGWRLVFPGVVFLIVLLHEFGHAFACRWVGGEANQILMHPLGGLATVHPPRRPWPDFVTTAGGPAVNVVLLLVAAGVMYGLGGAPNWNPLYLNYIERAPTSHVVVFLGAYFLFVVNYGLLLFNLIPSFPLDGGQLLRAILWKPLGFYRAALISATIGIAGAAGMMVMGVIWNRWLLIMVGFMCIQMSVQMRRHLLAAGPYAFQDDEGDYSASRWSVRGEDQREAKAAKKQGELAKKQAAAAEKVRERARQEAADEQAVIDRILAKVHAQGMQSLTEREKGALQEATERQRERAAGRR